MWFRSETPRARVLFCRHTNKIGARQARKWVGLRTLDVPAVTRWSSGSHVLRRHGLLPFDGTELVADDREREVECFRGHRLEVLVGCMP